MNKLSTMLFQVTVEQCCNNMLTILFIVDRTTLFTPVDINLEQVVDFLNFYACTVIFCGTYTCIEDTLCNFHSRVSLFNCGNIAHVQEFMEVVMEEMKFRAEFYTFILDLTRSSCEKYNYRQ